MATYKLLTNEQMLSSWHAYVKGAGVVELVKEKLEEVAAEAERALGSEEGREHAWAGGAADECYDGDDFFENVARAIEEALWEGEQADRAAAAAATRPLASGDR